MSTIVTRSGKGSPLTHNEVDTNFTNLNTDKVEKTSADITGGTINNTTVGATTPSTGVFTTLTATGQTSLGGVAGSESIRVLSPVATGSYLQVQSSSSAFVEFRALGTNSNNTLGFVSRGSGTVSFYTNNSTSNEQLRVSPTGSAVNYVQVTGAATGGRAIISMQGSDTNIPAGFYTKGSGSIDFRSYGGSNNQFVISGSAVAVNYFQANGSITGFGPVLSAQGSDTNINAVLQPKGTGALQAQQTDSTATGGNARGANAVDWQTSRDTAAKVASGAQSVVGGGQYNQASGGQSVVVGGSNVVSSGLKSASVGGENNTNAGQLAFLGGGYFQTLSSNGQFGFLGGGYLNTLAGFYNVIGGGFTNSGTSGSAVTTQSATMNATTAVTLSGSNANIKVGQLITGTSITNFPNTYVAAISGTSLTLSQAASGSSTSTLSFYTPHGVVVGGGNNQATGSYSFIGGGGDAGTAGNRNVASGDFSAVVGGWKNTASGLFAGALSGTNNISSGIGSVVCGGGTFGGITNIAGNTASGLASFVGAGFGNTASSNASFVGAGKSNVSNGLYSFIGGGTDGTTRGIWGSHVIPALNPLNGVGTSQSAILVLGKQTTDATATVLTVDGGSASTTNQVILPNNSAYYFKVEIIANVTGGGNTSGWELKGVIKRGANAASTTIVGSVTSTLIAQDAGASTWAVSATADTTNGGLKITCTGQASTTIRWVAKASTTEVTF